jgi:hypothetical protein
MISMRWMQQDPEAFSAGDSNLYRYVSNQPINLVDPSGLDPAFTSLLRINDSNLPRMDIRDSVSPNRPPESEPISFLGRIHIAPHPRYGDLGWSRIRESIENALQNYTIDWNAVGGFFRIVGGGAEVLVGIGGGILGGAVAAHGVDNIIAGFRTIASGRYQGSATETAISTGLQAVGMPEDAADDIARALDTAVGVLGPGAVELRVLARAAGAAAREALRGCQRGAALLQARAQQLFNAQRGHGNTVAVIRGRGLRDRTERSSRCKEVNKVCPVIGR